MRVNIEIIGRAIAGYRGVLVLYEPDPDGAYLLIPTTGDTPILIPLSYNREVKKISFRNYSTAIL